MIATRPRTLVHLSDLHLGRDHALDDATRFLAEALHATDVDHVVVTGDLTDRGRRREYVAFRRAFAPLARRGRLTIIPGNHDRLTDDVGAGFMPGRRVQAVLRDGLFLVRVDSTGPHNRRLVCGHGLIYEQDIADCVAALDRAPAGVLCAVLLHHHPLPLPEENLAERVANWFGRPWAMELAAGLHLLEALRGRCDLVLHGHRHTPSEMLLFDGDPRPLRVFNAGMTPRLGRARLFRHRAGELLAEPAWIDTAVEFPALPLPAAEGIAV